MIGFALIFLLFTSNFGNGEQPKSVCQSDKPYRTKETLCTSFTDVCVKTGDPDCENFQSACNQCPPSNYSILMFMDMVNMKNDLKTTKSQLQNLTVEFQNHVKKTAEIYTKQSQNKSEMIIIMLAILIIIIICTLLMILEVRFKIITKLLKIKVNKYKILRSRKSDCVKENVIQPFAESKGGNTKLEDVIKSSAHSIESKINVAFGRIEVILKSLKVERLKISSIFDDNDRVEILYNNTDFVEKIKNSVADQFKLTPNNFVLFIKNQCLDETKPFHKYETENNSSLQFCCIKERTDVEVGTLIFKRHFFSLYNAIDKTTKKEILLRKYEMFPTPKLKDNEHILKELEIFQITKLNERFVKLLNIYYDSNFIYCAMENLSERTIKEFLKENWPLKNGFICLWSSQILEGLQYLHKNSIICRDLNPYSFLVDGDKNIKLYSLNFAISINSFKPSSMIINNPPHTLPFRYLAPEILKNEKYNAQTDVWSFAAVLIKIITSKKPYPDLSRVDAGMKILEKHYIEYELPNGNKDENLESFIDSCLKPISEGRATIDQLMNHELLKNNKIK